MLTLNGIFDGILSSLSFPHHLPFSSPSSRRSPIPLHPTLMDPPFSSPTSYSLFCCSLTATDSALLLLPSSTYQAFLNGLNLFFKNHVILSSFVQVTPLWTI
jgi:hypothetical protein